MEIEYQSFMIALLINPSLPTYRRRGQTLVYLRARCNEVDVRRCPSVLVKRWWRGCTWCDRAAWHRARPRAAGSARGGPGRGPSLRPSCGQVAPVGAQRGKCRHIPGLPQGLVAVPVADLVLQRGARLFGDGRHPGVGCQLRRRGEDLAIELHHRAGHRPGVKAGQGHEDRGIRVRGEQLCHLDLDRGALAAQQLELVHQEREHARQPGTAVQLHRLLRRQRAAVQVEMTQLLAAHPDTAILMSLSGFHTRTVARTVVELDGKVFASAAQLASYAGVAPVTKQSGTSLKHQIRNRHGNKPLRQAWYMAAFASLRTDRRYLTARRAKGWATSRPSSR